MEKIGVNYSTDSLSPVEKESVMKLWNLEYPAKLAYDRIDDFDSYINGLESPTHILVKLNNEIVGWATKFLRNHEKWFAIILSSAIQGHRIGSKVMMQLKANEEVLYGWVIDHNDDSRINGELYLPPLNFYLKQGFEIIKEQRLELPTLSAVKISWKNPS
ncbi:GNAT family N-acetyltransferase [Sphingobacterium corticibacterium]|uniref:GNAT family N-acetyltransferase n=1 Tax=Sphingobacterium corticibacterium TaxID=2484746 RepID=A0A4Q6XPD2_9SPHI|nr:GNAT family N-acetyltransferase [Sphingobacterium corticibacterium]RZF62083.1 GNAT family N-acetyltransferase [Sphingobacterium corticibacterium]